MRSLTACVQPGLACIGKLMLLVGVVLGSTAWGPLAFAEPQVITMEGTRIRGNQELPTVLYVVPWQPPELKQLDKPAQSFTVTQSLPPLKREEFQRKVAYHERFIQQQSASKEAE